jgi:glutamate-cysteine ligase
MGEEITKSQFTASDFERFSQRLREETQLLARWFRDGTFASQGKMAGFELEAWLVDDKYIPAALNERFLQCLNSTSVVPELSRFNVEFNSSARPVNGKLLRSFREELEKTWKRCEECAHSLEAHMVMIGILPSLRDEMLTLENMSPLLRYRALNDQVLRLREGQPLKLDILGYDHLIAYHRDVMLESCTTSLQIHLQVEPEQATRFFNASLVLSAPMVAISANSPFLFGKELWEETRIPLFEQAVDLDGFRDAEDHKVGRVTFGSSYVSESLLECFVENLDHYPVMLPIVCNEDSRQLSHLRLHNGTIWRWNRPIVSLDEKGMPLLRIEHRVAAAAPSLADTVANIAFYLGLVQTLATNEVSPESQIPFIQAQKNFYLAAREGLSGKIPWLKGRVTTIKDLVLDELLPMAQKGLSDLGLNQGDIDYYLGEVMKNRVKTGQTGAAWQRAFVHKYGRDFQALTSTYAERQRSGKPVYEWSV